MVEIIHAKTDQEVQTAKMLFEEYAEWLGLDLGFQNFQEELDSMPGKYAGPAGRLVIAKYDGDIAGCAAVRKLQDGVCEMKRLFVREKFRGKGIGKALAEIIVEDARKIGYKKMRLDTDGQKMFKAMAIYKSMGFMEIEAYYHNPYDGVVYLELEL
jgi:putative acetyltransferase